MKQRFLIVLLFCVVVALLIGLNAASYTQKEKTPDSELYANRSSFNSGSTGTQAWFTLLAETGRKVQRWQDAPASLLTSKTPPAVFVIVGSVRRSITDKEAETLLTWVARGGRLVLIDREPPEELVVTTSDWKVGLRMVPDSALFTADPSNQQLMTTGVQAVKPAQPSLLTQGVNAIQPSRFAQTVTMQRLEGDAKPEIDTSRYEGNPPPGKTLSMGDPVDEAAGPVVHFARNQQNVVVEVPFNSGRIVFVSDPYMVSNSGIGLADNAQFAANLVATPTGAIAFDEYHQGYSNDSNRFLQFFAGTPVVAIFLQAAALIALVFYSQSRRFGRPVPEPEPDRLSKLEYVAAMAELQQRARAWDLAIENIYGEFRRRAARLFGLDIKEAVSETLAKRVAERTDLSATSLRETFFKCEEIIRGEPTNKAEAVRLTGEIRGVEQQLGLTRGGRAAS
jgi:hypothetical protein